MKVLLGVWAITAAVVSVAFGALAVGIWTDASNSRLSCVVVSCVLFLGWLASEFMLAMLFEMLGEDL